MSFRLVCKKCGTWEWRREWLGIDVCPECGAGRYAEDLDGKPLIIWTKQQDPNKWSLED